MIKDRKILIVGKNSFISKALAEQLDGSNKIEAILHDRWVDGSYDIIINVACPASPGDNGIEILDANSYLVNYLLDVCYKEKIMLIQLSSGEADMMRDIDHPHRCYSVGKQFAETLCYEYYKKYGVDTRIVRLYNTYGKGMRLDYPRCQSTFINDAINNDSINVKGQARHIRTFTHIDDTVRGIDTIIEKGKAGETYELANPKPVSIADFARVVGMVVNKQVVFSGADIEPDTIVPYISKLTELGWKAEIELEEGLSKTICG